mgnify:CR=1 FL=1
MKLEIIILALFTANCGSERVDPREQNVDPREVSKDRAHRWMEHHKIIGTISCNYPSEDYCDVVPADSRQPITLNCMNGTTKKCFLRLPY